MSPALRTGIYGTLFLGLFLLYLPLQAHKLDQSLHSLAAWISYVGVGLLLVGAMLVLASAYYLVRRGHGTPAPFDPPQKFVVAGPYAYVRNPMMLGLLATVFGEALWLRSLGVFLYALLLALVVHAVVLYVEEPRLKERFGEAYQAYLDRVGRWMPWRPSR